MARNERFAALQRERMTAIVSSLDTPENRIYDVSTIGLQRLRDHTFLSLDTEKTESTMRGIIEKFEAHNMISQVNRLEDSLDNFLDTRLGERKEVESDLHWGVIDFLIHLSNSPTNAHEIENPVKPSEAEYLEESSEEVRHHVDRSQWKDDDETLSTWSDVTQSDNEDDDVERESGPVGMWTSRSLPRPPVPKSCRVPNPPKSMTSDMWVEYYKHRDRVWVNEDPPWVEYDKSVKGLSDVCPIPNNQTHNKSVRFERAKNDGLGGFGYKITHERQLMYWICQFGQGYPLGNEFVFKWDQGQDQYVTDEKLTLTICVPGTIAAIIEPFRIMSTKLRVLQRHLETYRFRDQNPTLKTFVREMNDLLENRIFVFFRRMARNVQVYPSNPIDLHILRDLTIQVRGEVDFLHRFGMAVMEPIATDRLQSEPNIAGHVLETLEGWVNCVELACPHLLPEFYHMMSHCFEPWLFMVGTMTAADGIDITMDDFPISVNPEIISDNHLFWTKAVDVRLTQVPKFFESILPPLCDAVKACEILKHGQIWQKEIDPCLFQMFTQKFNQVQRFERVRPQDSFDSHRESFSVGPMFDDTDQFGILSDFVAEFFVQPVPFEVPRLDKVDDLIRPTFDWHNYWNDTITMERILGPVRTHLLTKTGNFLTVLRRHKAKNVKSFEEYIHAVTSFYLGQTGDILSDISHIISDGITDRASQTIKINAALESCSLRWLGEHFRVGFDGESEKRLDRQITVEMDIPTPAKFIINDEAMSKYQELYRLNLRLRLAQISLEGGGSKESDGDRISSFRLEQHLRMIIGALFSFIQSGVILPLLHEFNTKMENATTFDEIFKAHGSMLDLICTRSLATTKGNVAMGKPINRVISLAIKFKKIRDAAELERSYQEFIRDCTDIKIILDSLASRSTQMVEWIHFLSDVFYYTPQRNAIQGEVITQEMKHPKGVLSG